MASNINNNSECMVYPLQSYFGAYQLTDEQLALAGYPVKNRETGEITIVNPSQNFTGAEYDQSYHLPATQYHRCVRCRNYFEMTDDDYITKDGCWYHWGKVVRSTPRRRQNGCILMEKRRIYSCCNGNAPCTRARRHVWNGQKYGQLIDENKDFFDTGVNSSTDNDNIYAMDCEMSFTIKGLEVSKLTLINIYGDLVYETLIKPVAKIVDYNTRWSGITEMDYSLGGWCYLRDVHQHLKHLIGPKTILVGHSLDGDLRALKMIHGNVVDTSLVYPHHYGFPYKYSLKSLMKEYLRKDIQMNPNGHNSYEDAQSCLDLMMLRIRQDFPNVNI